MMNPLTRLRSLLAGRTGHTDPASDSLPPESATLPEPPLPEPSPPDGAAWSSQPVPPGPWHEETTDPHSGMEPEAYEEEVEFTVTPWGRLHQIAFSGRAYDRGTAGGTLVSVILHGVLFLLVAEIAVDGPVSSAVTELRAYMINEQEEIPEPEPLLTLAPVDEEPKDDVLASISMSAASVVATEPDLPLELLFPEVDNPHIKLEQIEPKEIAAAELARVVERPGQVGEEQLYLEGAVDRITLEIMERLHDGPVLVVWLMDESISLVDQRAEVAERLEKVYEEIGQTKDRRRAGLLSAVVGFGHQVKERVAPTTDYERVLKEIGDVNADPTGIENVFSAVIYAVQKYRPLISAEKRQIMCVVWTDESGDDYLRVEEAAQLCRRFKVPVYTVGPSSMFGKQIGTMEYVDPEDSQVYNLPVFRGPDSAFQERINLPFWFSGSQLDNLHAGIGPYALSRLAIETGGVYFIHDAEADRAPFRLENMRGLLPEYVSAQAYQQSVARSPFRTAIRRAVEMSYQYELKGTPQLEFAPTGRTYQTELIEAQQTAAYNIARIEQMLAVFGHKGLEEQYENETSGRWRAWYDLNYGRLLAAAVRNNEYNLACAEMKNKGAAFVDQESNRWVFRPSDKYRSTSTEGMANEARRLLTRVIENHPETPFSVLAERELRHGFGFEVDETYVAPPPPPAPRPVVDPNNPNPPPPPPPPPTGRREEQLRQLQRKPPDQLPKL